MYRLIEALGGPILEWELKRAGRGYLRKFFVFGYAAWLLLLALLVFYAARPPVGGPPDPDEYYFDHLRAHHDQVMFFLDTYLAQILQYQLMLVIAITPALTASCLGQEKERGTFFFLFGTELTPRQIVLGKLLGRLVLLVPVIFTAVPLLVFMVSFTGQEFALIFLALIQQMIVAFTLGAVCLLIGIWVRRTADAVIVAYLVLALGCAAIRWLTPSLRHSFWLDPVASLEKMLNGGSWVPFVVHLDVWALAGAGCLRLAWGQVREVCLRQPDQRPPRRVWAFRPPVGNDAIRWRECFIIGLAPIPILRMVPRWLGLVGVFAFSAVLAGLIADEVAAGFLSSLWQGRILKAFADLRTEQDAIAESVWVMGLVFILFADLLLLVRCATSVAEEKRRNTWDDLLLTAQSFREITNGKMWGILQATVPVVIAFALPVCLLAAMGGPKAMFIAAMWIMLPCLAVYVAALSGIDMMRVPKDMDETRPGGAFWYESRRQEKGPYRRSPRRHLT